MANARVDAETTTVGRLQPLVFPLVALIAGAIQVGAWGYPFAETFLRWFLVVTVGVQGIWAFLGHYFRSDDIAAYIGWPVGNPFQEEVAFANLAFGTLGVLCFWLRDGFWTATVVGISVFMLGAAAVHLREIRTTDNRAPGNAGAILLTDVVIPVVLLALLVTTRL
ncbi:DUF6790 family protein [Haladaptatus salinisoli]|uniref:DUF6790 family protein n=1 Tax=Haladaptatus salinisoli TaxID=2884876 RepID=UPI001D09EDBF|nr:DUF6790 family protein [Haladaptatus salinisoli]